MTESPANHDVPEPINGMIGSSSPMTQVYRMTRLAANSASTVLLTGETGTGKELIARAIHNLSPRSTGPYVRINCGALSESLLESELFGHVKGAFTSAIENRTGRFEAAHGGTIFLDEINSTSLHLQVKLLRVLQEHEFERVGDSRTVQVDCRIVAATNRDLLEEVDQGKFREDLYYRLNVLPIELPPLRDRGSDIVELAEFFAKRHAIKNNRDSIKIIDKALELLQNYAWPGNVRELENYIERAIVLSSGQRITDEHLPNHVRGLSPVRIPNRNQNDMGTLCTDLVSNGLSEAHPSDNDLHQQIVSQVEKELISQVLRICQGVQTKTATRLGINRNTLHKKIEEYDLQSEAR